MKNQMLCRLDSEFVERLDRYWREHKRPDPKCLEDDISFSSRAEFIGFVLRAVTNMDPISWSFFARWFRGE